MACFSLNANSSSLHFFKGRTGEPIALITPPPLPKPKLWIGSLRDTVKITGDIISPALDKKDFDLPPQDPADRFLSATAMVYDLTLLTADKRLTGAKEFPVLPIP